MLKKHIKFTHSYVVIHVEAEEVSIFNRRQQCSSERADLSLVLCRLSAKCLWTYLLWEICRGHAWCWKGYKMTFVPRGSIFANFVSLHCYLNVLSKPSVHWWWRLETFTKQMMNSLTVSLSLHINYDAQITVNLQMCKTFVCFGNYNNIVFDFLMI